MNTVIQHSFPLHKSQHPLIPSVGSIDHRNEAIWSHRIIERLARHLEYLTSLDPLRDHVTFILGHGECPTNHHALVAWLYEQLDESPVEMDKALSMTFEALQSMLSQEVYS
jgi:hypothetical protein